MLLGRVVGRRATVIAFVCIAVACCGAFASAASHKSPAPALHPVTQTHAGMLPKLLAHPLLAAGVARGDRAAFARLGSAGRSPATAARSHKHDKRMLKPFIYAAAVDGGFAYSVETTRALPADLVNGNDFVLPSRVVRSELATGVKTTLLTTTHSVVIGLVAAHGRVALSLVKIGAGRKSSTIDSQILTALHTDARLTTVDAQFARYDERRDSICGAGKLLTGISDQGELLALSANEDCQNKQPLKSAVVGVSADGTTRVLDDSVGISAMYFGGIHLNSDLLIGVDGFGAQLSARNIDTGEVKRYWADGGGAVFDQASDGSVAIAPRTLVNYFDFEDEPVDDRPTEAPLLVFPQGNADSPVIASETSSKTTTLKFCGAYLYELRGFGDNPQIPVANGDLSATPQGGSLRTQVIQRHASGEFIGAQNFTPKTQIQAVGCSGDALQLATSRGLKVSVRSFGQ